MKDLSFESVNKEIEDVNLEELASGLRGADVTAAICKIWAKIGNIIRLIANLPLIPKKWRQALKLLISTLDSICA